MISRIFVNPILMLEQKTYCTLIIPDHIYEEIQLFQTSLLREKGNEWTFTKTFNLLLKFCLSDYNFRTDKEDFELIQKYFAKKEFILEELNSSILLSAVFDDYNDL